MAREFKRLRPGDELTCKHINEIYDELDRWRKMQGSGSVAVNYVDDVTSPPVIIGHDADATEPALFPTGIGAGTYAAPASKSDVILLEPAGAGWTTTNAQAPVTVFNPYATALTGANKFGFVRHRGGNVYDFMVGDC